MEDRFHRSPVNRLPRILNPQNRSYAALERMGHDWQRVLVDGLPLHERQVVMLTHDGPQVDGTVSVELVAWSEALSDSQPARCELQV